MKGQACITCTACSKKSALLFMMIALLLTIANLILGMSMAKKFQVGRKGDVRTSHINSTIQSSLWDRALGTTVQTCRQEGKPGRVWPECTECVPGLQPPVCTDNEFPVLLQLKKDIYEMAFLRYGSTGAGGHLYPYLETSSFQQRQEKAVQFLKQVNAQRIIDFGAYFNQLERFAEFNHEWCPVLILSIDPIYNGTSKGIPCGNSSGWVTIIHAPLSAALTLKNPFIKSRHFDSVVCLGCDPGYGPKLHELESFRRPYHLILETVFDEYLKAPTTGDGIKIREDFMQLPDPPRNLYHGDRPYTKRKFRILNYKAIFTTNVCSYAFFPQAVSKCGFPYEAPKRDAGSKVSHYTKLAEIAEEIWACKGFQVQVKAEEWDVGSGRRHKCNMRGKMPGRFAFDQPWGTASGEIFDTMSRYIASCLENWDVLYIKTCECIEHCSLAWSLANGFTNPAQFPRNASLRNIVSAQHRCMNQMFKTDDWEENVPCVQFPKRLSELCGGMQSYGNLVRHLEPLYLGGRNMMYHERGELIEFTSYLPLPSVPGFNDTVQGRKVLCVVGANGFYRATKFLIDMYSPYWDFDEVYLLEPDNTGMKIPDEYRKKSNISFIQGFINVGSRDEKDFITFLQSKFLESDFLVVMFDVDEASLGPTMEWGFMADLLSQNRSIVDELFIELHMFKPDIMWHFDRHSSREQFDVMSQLRRDCGFAVHAWP